MRRASDPEMSVSSPNLPSPHPKETLEPVLLVSVSQLQLGFEDSSRGLKPTLYGTGILNSARGIEADLQCAFLSLFFRDAVAAGRAGGNSLHLILQSVILLNARLLSPTPNLGVPRRWDAHSCCEGGGGKKLTRERVATANTIPVSLPCASQECTLPV